MVKPHKVELLSEIRGELSGIQLAVLADYRGLNVEKMTDLRRKLRAEKAGIRVVKNSFLKKINKEMEWQDMESMLHGPTIIAFAKGDAVAAAKVMHDFAKVNAELKIKGGLLDGALIKEDEVTRLAALPAKPQLVSQLLSVMQGPARNLVCVLSAPMRNLVCAMQAIADKKSQN